MAAILDLGKDAILDYDVIIHYVTAAILDLGRDAILDYDVIIHHVMAAILDLGRDAILGYDVIIHYVMAAILDLGRDAILDYDVIIHYVMAAILDYDVIINQVGHFVFLKMAPKAPFCILDLVLLVKVRRLQAKVCSTVLPHLLLLTTPLVNNALEHFVLLAYVIGSALSM